MTSIVVLGDIHGNARALRAAVAQARTAPVDRWVLVGDLLTYGHDVDEVLDIVEELQTKDDAVLLVGNHDQMYFDLAGGNRDYMDKLPPWIRDSVELTVKNLDLRAFRERFRWSAEWIFGTALFAHANPFGHGDFRYLNSPGDCADAVSALRQRGARLGVFGHTHRPVWLEGLVTLANAGAVGQPRDTGGSVILRLQIDGDVATGTFEPIAYDIDAHLDGLRRTGLPAATTARLCGFFEQAT